MVSFFQFYENGLTGFFSELQTGFFQTSTSTGFPQDRLALTVRVAKFLEQRLHNQVGETPTPPHGRVVGGPTPCESFAVLCRTGSLRSEHPIDYQYRTFPPSKIKKYRHPHFGQVWAERKNSHFPVHLKPPRMVLG